MDADPNETSHSADAVFLEFGRACRAERDRIQIARLEAEDRRFENASDQAIAERFAHQLIASIGRR